MGDVSNERIANGYVLDPDGVTEAPFAKQADGSWVNTGLITIRPGAVLTVGGGGTFARSFVLANPSEPVKFTVTME